MFVMILMCLCGFNNDWLYLQNSVEEKVFTVAEYGKYVRQKHTVFFIVNLLCFLFYFINQEY